MYKLCFNETPDPKFTKEVLTYYNRHLPSADEKKIPINFTFENITSKTLLHMKLFIPSVLIQFLIGLVIININRYIGILHLI